MPRNEFAYNILGRTLTYPASQVSYFKARKVFMALARKASADFETEWNSAWQRENDLDKVLVQLKTKYENECVLATLNALGEMGCFTFTKNQLLSWLNFGDAQDISRQIAAKKAELCRDGSLLANDPTMREVESQIQARLAQEVFTDTFEVYRRGTVERGAGSAVELILLLSRKFQGDTSVHSRLSEMRYTLLDQQGGLLDVLFNTITDYGKEKYLLGFWDGVGTCEKTENISRRRDSKWGGWDTIGKEYHVHVTADQNRARLRAYYVEEMIGDSLLRATDCTRIAHDGFMQMIISAYELLLRCYEMMGIDYSIMKCEGDAATVCRNICENIRAGVVPTNRIPEQCFRVLQSNPYYHDGYELARSYFGDPNGDLARMMSDFDMSVPVFNPQQIRNTHIPTCNSQNDNGPCSDFETLLRAAKAGDAQAQFSLGCLYSDGDGVEKNEREAVRWYRKAAEQRNADAQACLGDCYKDGVGVTENPTEAVRWYRKAAAQGHAGAQVVLGSCCECGIGTEKDLREAVMWYRKAAEQGDAVAQCCLGVCYENGNGVEVNSQEAVRLYRLAADQGDARAQFYLGVCYENGDGVEVNPQEAVRLYRLAADQGDARAQWCLGLCYESGNGVEENPQEAVRLYHLSAENGNAYAQNSLGQCFMNGIGVAEDKAEAARWWRDAAEQGLVDAQRCLGQCYANGDGVTENKFEAVEWYRKAAEQGDAVAQYLLGSCYDEGKGVNKNQNQAVEWYRDAAEQGHSGAQLALGICYLTGQGVAEDTDEGVKWIRMAAEQGDDIAQDTLGLHYEDIDVVEAVKWYRAAAEQGNANAQEALERLADSR